MADLIQKMLKYIGGLVVFLLLIIYLFSWMGLVYLFMAYLILLAIAKWQLGTPVFCHSSARLDEKTVIITGGNAGVGLETAVDMASRGARVVLGCRNEERAQNAVKAIKERSGNSNVVYYLLDLADFESIRNFAKEVLHKESRLDILINNAGVGRSVVYGGPKTTEQGFEIVFGTNYLGPFLLTYLLLDLLQKSAPSQVINLSSVMQHFLWKKLVFRDGKINVDPYAGSKLGNVMHARELARRYKDCGIRANSVHPGFVDTEIWTPIQKAIPSWLYALWRTFLRCLALDCKGGAQTTIYVAVDESAQGYSGEYFSACQKAYMSSFARDDKACEELWEESLRQCGLAK